MSKLTDAVLALAEPVAAQQGCEIWDVEYVKEAGSRYLRVYIDKPDGVSIQDCEDFSRALDPILDEADPIPDSYIFEVSSAGRSGSSSARVISRAFSAHRSRCGSTSRSTAARCTSARSSSMTTGT